MSCVQSLGIVSENTRIRTKTKGRQRPGSPEPYASTSVAAESGPFPLFPDQNEIVMSDNPANVVRKFSTWPVPSPNRLVGYSRKMSTKILKKEYKKRKSPVTKPEGRRFRPTYQSTGMMRRFFNPS